MPQLSGASGLFVHLLKPLADTKGDLGYLASKNIILHTGLTPETRVYLMNMVKALGARRKDSFEQNSIEQYFFPLHVQEQFVIDLIEQDTARMEDLDELFSQVKSGNKLAGLMLARLSPLPEAVEADLIEQIDKKNSAAYFAAAGSTESWVLFDTQTRFGGIPLNSLSDEQLRAWLTLPTAEFRPYLAVRELHRQGESAKHLLPELFSAMSAKASNRDNKARCIIAAAERMGASIEVVAVGLHAVRYHARSSGYTIARTLEKMAQTPEERAWAKLWAKDQLEESLAALGERSAVIIPQLLEMFCESRDEAKALQIADTIIRLDPTGKHTIRLALDREKSRQREGRPAARPVLARGPPEQCHPRLSCSAGSVDPRDILSSPPKDSDLLIKVFMASAARHVEVPDTAIGLLTGEQRLEMARELVKEAIATRRDNTPSIELAIRLGKADPELAELTIKYLMHEDPSAPELIWKLLGIADPQAKADIAPVVDHIVLNQNSRVLYCLRTRTKAILPRPQPVNHQVDHRQLDHRDAA